MGKKEQNIQNHRTITKSVTDVQCNGNTREEREKGTEEIFEVIFPKLMTNTKPQIQEVQGKSST